MPYLSLHVCFPLYHLIVCSSGMNTIPSFLYMGTNLQNMSLIWKQLAFERLFESTLQT